MDSNIIITRAVPEDAEATLEYLKIIGGESDNMTFGAEGFPMTAENEAKYIASMEGSRTKVMYVAKENGRIVGEASYNSYTRPRLRHRGEFGISVLRSHQNRGIGSALLAKILDFARDVAENEIVNLEVRSDNAAAIHLYEKFGFRRVGRMEGYLKIDGKLIDCDIMQLRFDK